MRMNRGRDPSASSGQAWSRPCNGNGERRARQDCRAYESAPTGLLLGLALLACVCAPSLGEEVLKYEFTSDQPFIVDQSGSLNHGLAHEAARVADAGRPCLKLGPEGYVQMPEAQLVLGKHPAQGAIELSVKPNFDPSKFPAGIWEGWVALIYFQKTSGNGLPDGYNEIGLALHGPKLRAKVVGGRDTAPFATIDCPLKQGQWTKLKLEWDPGRRALYVDDKLVAERKGQYEAPEMDMFPAFIGRHPASGKWGFEGLVADVTVSVTPTQ